LSITVKDEEWSKMSSGKTSSFDYIDSGRGSSNGYHSSTDAFSPLSTNSSLGSRSSPPNLNSDSSGCSKMFGNDIWSSEPKTVSKAL